VEDVCNGLLNPKLSIVAEPPRRNAWVTAVKEKVKNYLDAFGYTRL